MFAGLPASRQSMSILVRLIDVLFGASCIPILQLKFLYRSFYRKARYELLSNMWACHWLLLCFVIQILLRLYRKARYELLSDIWACHWLLLCFVIQILLCLSTSCGLSTFMAFCQAIQLPPVCAQACGLLKLQAADLLEQPRVMAHDIISYIRPERR